MGAILIRQESARHAHVIHKLEGRELNLGVNLSRIIVEHLPLCPFLLGGPDHEWLDPVIGDFIGAWIKASPSAEITSQKVITLMRDDECILVDLRKSHPDDW
jgi:hypothetical protein